jgi:hypothetical protein
MSAKYCWSTLGKCKILAAYRDAYGTPLLRVRVLASGRIQLLELDEVEIE